MFVPLINFSASCLVPYGKKWWIPGEEELYSNSNHIIKVKKYVTLEKIAGASPEGSIGGEAVSILNK
jgi:hypothetical protein